MKNTHNQSASYIFPDWDAPANVGAVVTTRIGGRSCNQYASYNLAQHVGDNKETVAKNRQQLKHQLALPSEPQWLNQVHGTTVIGFDENNIHHKNHTFQADAAWTKRLQTVCTIMTADCLPVLLCDASGTMVAAIHCGWRSLSAGILEKTIAAMNIPPKELLVWLGPAIGPTMFEVGDDVRDIFTKNYPATISAFSPKSKGKWFGDIYKMARKILIGIGIEKAAGGDYCTYCDDKRFFSYRRNGITGRMAALIWLS